MDHRPYCSTSPESRDADSTEPAQGEISHHMNLIVVTAATSLLLFAACGGSRAEG